MAIAPSFRAHDEAREATEPADAATAQSEITLTGRVFDALGRPFGNGWIRVAVAAGPSLAQVELDESGAYELGPFPVARADAEATLTLEPYHSNGRHVERVALPQQPGLLSHDIHLTDLSILRVHVVNRTGAPIAHAEVSWRSGSDHGERQADETGLLELVGLAPGSIVLEAFTPRGEMFEHRWCSTLVAERTVEVVAGALVEVELRDRFAERRPVELALRWPDGTLHHPPYDIIQVWGFEDGVPVAKAKATPVEDLFFVELPDLEHEVLQAADGSIHLLGTVPQENVRAGRIELPLQVSALCGTARDAAGTPLTTEELVLVWLDVPPHLARLAPRSASRFPVLTDALGDYCRSFLPPGRWAVTTTDGIALEGGPFDLGAAEVQRGADVWLR